MMSFATGVPCQRLPSLPHRQAVVRRAQPVRCFAFTSCKTHWATFRQRSLFAYDINYMPRLFPPPRIPDHKKLYERCSGIHTAPVTAGDRSVAVSMLSQPEEVLEFFSTNQDLDVETLHVVLRKLARLSKDPDIAASVESDKRFGMLMESLEAQIEQADGRQLAQIANALALTRIGQDAKKQLAAQLGRETIRRKGCLSPRSLCTLAAALATLQVKDLPLQQFVWAEVNQQLHQLQPSDLCLLLVAMRRWGIYSRRNCDLLLERMAEEADAFSAEDVAVAVDAMACMGVARGFLLRRLSSLAFANLKEFSQINLLLLMRGLGRLRFLTAGNCRDILNHLQVDMSGTSSVWNPHRSALLLGTLAVCNVENSLETGSLIKLLLGHVEDNGGSPASSREDVSTNSFGGLGVAAIVDAAYAICFYALHERSQLLEKLLGALYNRQPSKDRMVLLKLQEIQNALRLEFCAVKADTPLGWRAAVEEAARLQQDRTESSGLHAEVMMALDLLRGRYRLQLQRNCVCGGYRVDFFDAKVSVAIDVDTVYRPSNCRMRHRHLALQGISPVCVEYWKWRRCRTEEDQLLYLKQLLTAVLSNREDKQI